MTAGDKNANYRKGSLFTVDFFWGGG